jgi:hypothetical protein
MLAKNLSKILELSNFIGTDIKGLLSTNVQNAQKPSMVALRSIVTWLLFMEGPLVIKKRPYTKREIKC